MLVSQEKYCNNSNNCNDQIAFFKLFKFFKMQVFFFIILLIKYVSQYGHTVISNKKVEVF